jgi:rhodanese-related sulfurtransferase
MKTMDCATLETLVENHERIELIDVRPRSQFAAMHIRGARSLPFAELASPKIFLRPRPRTDRVYVIADDRARASLATGILRAAGWSDAVVVDGGMKAWIAQGFPVLGQKFSLRRPNLLLACAILLGMGAGIALSLNDIVIAALFLINAAALLLRSAFRTRLPARETSALNLTKLCPA